LRRRPPTSGERLDVRGAEQRVCRRERPRVRRRTQQRASGVQPDAVTAVSAV